jgi:hypothetical protein
MKLLELHRFKKAIGAITFGLFFPNENKRLEQKQGIGKQPDFVLVHVPIGKQTLTVDFIRLVTGWSVKKATFFVKEGDFPKVIIYNVDLSIEIPTYKETLEVIIEKFKTDHNIIFDIY